MLYDYTSVTVDSVRPRPMRRSDADEHVARAVASAGSPSFDDTLPAPRAGGRGLIRAYGRGAFMGQVHADAAVRDAGKEAEERINKWRVAVVFRVRPVPRRSRLRRHRRGTSARGRARPAAGALAARLPSGRHELGADERAELERLRTRLVEVEVAFQRNLNEFRDGIEVTREQLAGLPDAYVERLTPGEREGTYRVSLDYPEVNPFMEQAHDRDLRRELFHKDWSKAVGTNRPLLEEALDLRRRIAELLGDPTWAHHAMEVKMARTPERVATSTRSSSRRSRAGAGASSIAGRRMHARRPRRSDHGLGLSLLRRRAAARGVRRRPEPGRRVPAARTR